MLKCSICGKAEYSRGLCRECWMKLPEIKARFAKGDYKKCLVRGCEEVHSCQGMCRMHYNQLPSVQARSKQTKIEFEKKPGVKEKRAAQRRAYDQRPEVKARKSAHTKKKYWADPEKARRKSREMQRKRYKEKPEEIKKYQKEYTQRPYVIEHRREKDMVKLAKVMDTIGISPETQKAIVMDGPSIDKQMKKLQDAEEKRMKELEEVVK